MAFDDFLDDFLPLYPEEDEETIRLRWEAWANEGRTFDDEDEWTDTREGSYFQITTMPGIREAAREYDLMGTEVVMAALVIWSWGTYLDDHGISYGEERLPATPARGIVRFTGANGTAIPAGTVVAVDSEDPSVEAPEYQTDAANVIPAGGFVDVPVTATLAGAFANVGVDAVTLAPTLAGVTVSNPAAIFGGTDPQSDEPFRDRLIARAQGEGGANADWYEQRARQEPGVGRASVIPLFAGPGTVLVIVTTAEGDQVSQAVVDSLQQRLDPPAFSTSLTAAENLPQATIDVVTTVGARPSVNGHIRIGDQLVSYGSLDADSFNGAAGGTGNFPIGTLVTQSGRGGGEAPVGHVVVVKTATALNVTIEATVEPEDGYSLDGTAGTLALRGSIEDAVRAYVERVEPGGEIVRTQVIAAIASVPGVHDVGIASVEINNVAANLSVPGFPTPQVPTLLAATLVQGSV